MHWWFLIKGIYILLQESIRAELSKIKGLCVRVCICVCVCVCVCVRVCTL